MTDDTGSGGNTLQVDLWAAGVAAVTIFALSQGQLRYANPVPLATPGLGLGLAVVALDVSRSVQRRRLADAILWAGLLSGVIGVYLVHLAANPAIAISQANDQRCAAIQADMLAAYSRISDAPDKFQALGCRPRGTDSRIFVPPTDREKRAGHALADGGYPRLR